MTSYDLLQWQTHLQTIEMLQAAGVSNREITKHDVYAADTAGQPGYVESVTADVLVIGVASDHMVNPIPGKKLAATLNARHLEVQSNCGHIGSSCENTSVIAAVREFLE
jgi:homoserine O-acetyltransferase